MLVPRTSPCGFSVTNAASRSYEASERKATVHVFQVIIVCPVALGQHTVDSPMSIRQLEYPGGELFAVGYKCLFTHSSRVEFPPQVLVQKHGYGTAS